MNTEYLNFLPRLKEILDTRKSIDESGRVIDIAGASTLNNIHVLRELILHFKPKATLEIGLAYGASALAILASLQEIAEGGRHTAIDPFQTVTWQGSAVRVLKEQGFTDSFRLIEDLSSLALPEMVRKNESFDLIYVDGSHLFEDVFVDFYFTARLLNSGGIVLFDDCRDHHVRKVMKFVESNYSGILSPFDIRPFEDPAKSLFKRIGNRMGVRQLSAFVKKGAPPRPWNSSFSNF